MIILVYGVKQLDVPVVKKGVLKHGPVFFETPCTCRTYDVITVASSYKKYIPIEAKKEAVCRVQRED